MNTAQADSDSARFATVRGDFERWRTERTSPREPIPDELWSKAAALCERYSVFQVARALRLNATRLKERVEERAEVVEPEAEFIEFRMAPYEAPQMEVPPIVVEMTDHYGQSVTIHLPSGEEDTVLALARMFWRRS